jgi:hypothetical protein
MVWPDASGAKRRSLTIRKEHDQGGHPPFDAMLSCGFCGERRADRRRDVRRSSAPAHGRDDNETIKNGEGPDDWSDKKKAHRVTDASVLPVGR